MLNKLLRIIFTCFFIFLSNFKTFAQIKLDAGSSNYAAINIGYMNLPFSAAQLNAGYKVQHIYFSNAGLRLILGHQFSKSFAAQVSYSVPFKYHNYNNINGDSSSNAVFSTIGGLSVKYVLPIGKNISVFGETGLSVVSRKGFTINNAVIVKNADFISPVFGAGIHYQLNNNIAFTASAFYCPPDKKFNQPYTQFFSGGIKYNPDLHQKGANQIGNHIFSKHMIQVGYSINSLGYGVNDFFEKDPLQIFWSGDIYIAKGISIQYQQKLYNSKKIFSIYWGTNFSYWQTTHHYKFFTLSVFPLIRLNLLHTKPADLYFNYSIAGPSYISKVKIDNLKTGTSFTFQDFMGLGMFLGKLKKLNAEIKIIHYSNGNLHPDNPGSTIPLTFNIGYSF